MKKLHVIKASFLLLAILFVFSCTQEANNPDGKTPAPSVDAFKKLRKDALSSRTQKFKTLTFTSKEGVKVAIDPSCITLNGTPVSAPFDVEFIELYRRADLLTTNIATMGKKTNGDLAMLLTGGAFYIKVMKDGKEVDKSSCISLQIPAALTGGTDPEMILWNGNIDAAGNLVWEEVPEGNVDNKGDQEAGGGVYYTFVNEFGWTNVDRFYDDPREKTTIKVEVPNGYNNENSAVYLSYDGEKNGLARLDTYADGIFSEHYGQIPIGLKVHIIFVSESKGKWVYAIKEKTIAANEVIKLLASDIKTAASETELKNKIKELP